MKDQLKNFKGTLSLITNSALKEMDKKRNEAIQDVYQDQLEIYEQEIATPKERRTRG